MKVVQQKGWSCEGWSDKQGYLMRDGLMSMVV